MEFVLIFFIKPEVRKILNIYVSGTGYVNNIIKALLFKILVRWLGHSVSIPFEWQKPIY